MALFLLSIWCLNPEFIYSIDFIRHLSLSIQWWYQGLQRLYFCLWYMVQHRHRVFDNSVRQPWLYFLLSIWCVGREFIEAVDSLRRLSLSILWWFWLQWQFHASALALFLLSIWCVGPEFVNAVTQYSLMISWSTMTLFSLNICRSVVT
jgi:hypothetical protein